MSRLRHSPAGIIDAWLMGSNLTSDPEQEKPWPGYTGYLPPTPDDVVACFDAEPLVVGRLLTGYTVRRWGVQVRVRVKPERYHVGWSKLTYIAQLCEQMTNERVRLHSPEYGEYILQSASIDSGPLFIGYDEETRRPSFTLNILVNIQRIV
jgi:hypothetical protein